MKLVGPWISILFLLPCQVVLRGEEFRDSTVLRSASGISIAARRASVVVPGLGLVTNAYGYDVSGAGTRPDTPIGLMPPVIAADRGETFRLTLQNDLEVKDATGSLRPSASNLHVHGLIVFPQGVGLDEPGAAHRYGDCVFASATSTSGHPEIPPAGDPCTEKAGRS